MYLIYNKQDMALNNLQGLIYHKTKQNQTISYIFNIYVIKRIWHQITYNGRYGIKPKQTQTNQNMLSILF